MSIFIFFIVLLILVLVHEFGHFFSAKKFGIRVDEFAFGFPPKLFGIKKGETEYNFNLLPLGGFVKIFGENPNEENISGPDSHRSFINRPKYQQAIVLTAGIFANFLLAWFLFYFAFAFGMPTSVERAKSLEKYSLENINLFITSVMKNSPAEKAGLQFGDRIVSVGNQEMKVKNPSPEDLKNFVIDNKEKEIEIEYIRNNKTNFVKLFSIINDSGKPIIGISMDAVGVLKLSPIDAILESGRLTIHATAGTFNGIYTLIKNAIHGQGDISSIVGPVGIVKLVGGAYDFSITYLLYFMALISINLAVINLLPIPALDGGRVFFLIIETIKGSRMKPNVVNIINTVGFFALIFLMIIVTYHDIVKLVK